MCVKCQLKVCYMTCHDMNGGSLLNVNLRVATSKCQIYRVKDGIKLCPDGRHIFHVESLISRVFQ